LFFFIIALSFDYFFLKDPHWYRAKNGRGRRGMIPYNYVKELEKGAVKLNAMP